MSSTVRADRREGAPPASVRQAGETRSARVESLRAIAALGVVFAHIFGVSRNFGPRTADTFFHRLLLGGGLGVFLFFTLSGYLLYLPFARAAFDDGRQPDLRRYAVNRAVRLVPLYLVVLTVLLVWQHGGGTFDQWWRFLTFSEGFSRRTVATVDGPMWSLAVEVHFYLLVPFVAWGIRRLTRGSMRRAFGVLAVGGAVLLAVRLVTVEAAHPVDIRWQYSIASNLFFFVPGMALCLVQIHLRRRERPLRGPLGDAAVWLATSAVVWLVVVWDYRLWLTPLAALASVILLGACVLPLRPSPLLSVLEWKPLAVVGVASYSLYLWHLPLIERVARSHLGHGFALLLATTFIPCVVVALVSYRVVEEPFLRLRRSWASG